MNYRRIQRATFFNRPNRFIAEVEIDGRKEVVHVKNTGRIRELLVPGCEVYLDEPGTPGRKTRFDLVAVRKHTGILFNIDSQAPNKVVKEWLEKRGYEAIRPEYTYGRSRIDFYMEKDGVPCLMEVKGCTLERDGVGYFPDAPTERGVKHLQELTQAVKDRIKAYLAFVIQMEGVEKVLPERNLHPAFGEAYDAAVAAGVEVLFLKCHVEPERMEIIE